MDGGASMKIVFLSVALLIFPMASDPFWKQPEHLCNKRDALQGKVKVCRLFCEVLESKENPIAIHGCAVEKPERCL